MGRTGVPWFSPTALVDFDGLAGTIPKVRREKTTLHRSAAQNTFASAYMRWYAEWLPTRRTDMAVYCVCYTIGETSDHTPEGPREKLQHLGEVCELTPSTWLLDTTLHSGAIMSRLQGVLGNNDQLSVIEVAKQGDWAIVQGPNVTQEGSAVWCERHVGQN